MLLCDVNILIYAHCAASKDHAWYRGWLEAQVNGPQPIAVSALAMTGFCRIVTQPTFPAAIGLPAALAMMETLVAHPNCRLIEPGPGHWRQVVRLCRAVNATGKAIADAQHAAVAIQHGCTWVTRDRDFAAYEPHGLRWMHLAPPAFYPSSPSSRA